LQADIAMIRAVIATSLGIAVPDHIVIGKDGHASLKRI
jgi:DNA repair protein RadC